MTFDLDRDRRREGRRDAGAQTGGAAQTSTGRNPIWRSLATSSPAHPPAIQPSVEVGAPDDAYEREANAVADRILRMHAPAAPGEGSPLHTPTAGWRVQRVCRAESWYRTAPNFCLDTWFSPITHQGERCYREIPRRSWPWSCPGAQHVCFDAGGRCTESPDVSSIANERESDGSCGFNEYCIGEHTALDFVPEAAESASGAAARWFREQLPPFYFHGLPVRLEAVRSGPRRPAMSGEALDPVLSSPGRPLDETTRAFFEPRLARDLGGVRLHTDDGADRAARTLGARAFTIGRDIAFARGEYDSGSGAGRRLLAHELTHTIQQGEPGGPQHVQRTFRPDELMDTAGAPLRSNPVAANPDTYFHRGSVGPRPGRRAVVIAGIHGSERSARELGQAAEAELGAGSQRPYFHTVVVPQANPAPRAGDRGAGSGATRVEDLNREFGTGYTSPSPYAQRLTTLVDEFDPERILSVHAIGTASLGGVFLDPIHQRLPARPAESGRDVDIRSYPPVSTPRDRAAAFAGDPRNWPAMKLTEGMIAAVPGPGTTSGNRPTVSRPPSIYPPSPGGDATASSSSLIYPLQGSMSGGVSLGTWASGHGRTVVTIEIPGYRAPRTTWESFLPAVWRFLAQRPGAVPAAPAAAAAPSSGADVE